MRRWTRMTRPSYYRFFAAATHWSRRFPSKNTHRPASRANHRSQTMNRIFRNTAWIGLIAALLGNAAAVRADDVAKKIRDDFRHSLVAVKYTVKTELGREDRSTAGVVVGDDGLVMIPIF